MSIRSGRLVAACIGAALLALSGCSSAGSGTGTATAPATSSSSAISSSTSSTAGSSTSSTSTSSTSTSSSSTSSTSSSLTTTSSSAPSATASTSFAGNPGNLPLTPPGAVLAIGQPADLPFTYLSAQGVFAVTVTSVATGTPDDWATLGRDPAELTGKTPVYVKATMTQKAGGDFSLASPHLALWGVLTNGDYAVPETAFTIDNPLCPEGFAPSGFTIGSSYDACLVFSLTGDQAMGEVHFEGDELAAGPYFDDPVVWK